MIRTTSQMRIHDKIRHILETTPGLTQKGLADRMGLNPAAVNRMLYGRRNIMAEEIPVIEAYIGQPLEISAGAAIDDYTQHQKPPRHGGLSDVAQQKVSGREAAAPGVAAALPPVPVYTYHTGKFILADWADRHPAQTGIADARAVYADGSAMEPRYFPGEIVYLHPNRPPQPGRDGFVEMQGGEKFICRIAGLSGDRLHAEFFNPPAQKTFSRKDISAIYSVIGRG